MARTRIVERNRRGIPRNLAISSLTNPPDSDSDAPDLTPRQIRYFNRQRRRALNARLEIERVAYRPIQPSAQERERLRQVRLENERAERRRAHELRNSRETEYQHLLFTYWAWHRRLSPEEFNVFKNPEIIPRYLWSHEDFLAHDFSWNPIGIRCSLLKSTIRRINAVSRLLSHPQEMSEANGWDHLVNSTRNYRHNFIRNYIPIESPPDSGSDESIMEDFYNSQPSHPWARNNESYHSENDSSDESTFAIEEAW